MTDRNREDTCHLDHAGGVVRVVQLTDTHLCRDPGGTLLSLDTDFSLQQVIATVQRERDAIDLVLATGDLADGGSVHAYERLETYLAPLCPRHFWLVGNHDDRDAMASIGEPRGRLVRRIRVGNWQILMLNSQIPGEVGGRLGEREMNWLQQQLEAGASEQLFSLVCLHHHPLSVDCAWLDQQQVSDGADFLALVDAYEGARAVLWGHIHQQIDRQWGSLHLMATPSTCVQFAPRSASFRADDLAPGYRWLDLAEDGSFDTGVSRVQGVAFQVDLKSDGYL